MFVLPFSLPASALGQAAGDQQPAAGAQQPAAGAQQAAGTQPAAQTPPKITFDSDIVLWGFAVNPDKTADYEMVLAKLKDALQKIQRPEVKQQAAGWKVIKNTQPQTDGSILYVHVLDPVVKGADYSINNLVYEAFTDYAERKAFYDMYSGSVKGALFAISGAVTDLSK
jgi:hypothetical protein